MERRPSRPRTRRPSRSRRARAPEPSVSPTTLVVGLGYIPSVQFAQFYLAEQNGYYADAGLDVEFQNKIDPDLITLVGQGAIDVGIGDGTSVIPAVSNGIPIAYVATIYGQFPNIVFAKASSGITTAADLKGKKIGIPGRYGSGWIMLQALLASAGLTTDDVEIVEYPDFTQAAAVEQGAVDAATGFANNEPVQLELHGEKAVDPADRRRSRRCRGPGSSRARRRSTSSTTRSPRSSRPRSRRWTRSRRTRRSGSTPRSRPSPSWRHDRETQAAILAATIATWSGPIQEARRPRRDRPRTGWDGSRSRS